MRVGRLVGWFLGWLVGWGTEMSVAILAQASQSAGLGRVNATWLFLQSPIFIEDGEW